MANLETESENGQLQSECSRGISLDSQLILMRRLFVDYARMSCAGPKNPLIVT